MDIRLGKKFNIGRYKLQGNLDIFNSLNSNPVTGYTQTLGSSYGKVTRNVEALTYYKIIYSAGTSGQKLSTNQLLAAG